MAPPATATSAAHCARGMVGMAASRMLSSALPRAALTRSLGAASVAIGGHARHHARSYAAAAPQFNYQDLFSVDPARKVETPFRKLTSDYVSTVKVGDKEFIQVCGSARVWHLWMEG